MDERVISADARHTVGAGLARHAALQKTRGPGWSRPGTVRCGKVCRKACGASPASTGRYAMQAPGSCGAARPVSEHGWTTRDQRGCPPHRRCRACPARCHAKSTRCGMVSPGTARCGKVCRKACGASPVSTGRYAMQAPGSCGAAGPVSGYGWTNAWSARMPATHRRCRACPARRHAKNTRGGVGSPARRDAGRCAEKHAGQAPHLRVCQCGCRACAVWLGRYRNTDGRTRDQRGCPPHRRCRACPARRPRPARRPAKNTRAGWSRPGPAPCGKVCRKAGGASPAFTGRGGPASRPGRRPGPSRSARWWSVPARSRTRWPRWAPRCRRRAR